MELEDPLLQGAYVRESFDIGLSEVPNRRSSTPLGDNVIDISLPVSHIQPSIELETHVFEMGNLLQTKFLVDRYAGWVRKRDPGNDGLGRRVLQCVQNCAVEPRSPALRDVLAI